MVFCQMRQVFTYTVACSSVVYKIIIHWVLQVQIKEKLDFNNLGCYFSFLLFLKAHHTTGFNLEGT